MKLEDRFRRVKILDEGFTDLNNYEEVYKVASNDSAFENFFGIHLDGSVIHYISNLKDEGCVKWEYIEGDTSSYCKGEEDEIEYIPKKDFYLALRGEPLEISIKFKGK